MSQYNKLFKSIKYSIITEKTNNWLIKVLDNKYKEFKELISELNSAIGKLSNDDAIRKYKLSKDDINNFQIIKKKVTDPTEIHNTFEEFQKNFDTIPKDVEERFKDIIIFNIEDAIKELKDYKPLTKKTEVDKTSNTPDITTIIPKVNVTKIKEYKTPNGTFDLIKINDFNASNAISIKRGNWCLGAAEKYYEDYTKNTYGLYFFLGHNDAISCKDYLMKTYKYENIDDIDSNESSSYTTREDALTAPLAIAIATAPITKENPSLFTTTFTNIHGKDITEKVVKKLFIQISDTYNSEINRWPSNNRNKTSYINLVINELIEEVEQKITDMNDLSYLYQLLGITLTTGKKEIDPILLLPPDQESILINSLYKVVQKYIDMFNKIKEKENDDDSENYIMFDKENEDYFTTLLNDQFPELHKKLQEEFSQVIYDIRFTPESIENTLMNNDTFLDNIKTNNNKLTVSYNEWQYNNNGYEIHLSDIKSDKFLNAIDKDIQTFVQTNIKPDNSFVITTIAHLNELVDEKFNSSNYTLNIK